MKRTPHPPSALRLPACRLSWVAGALAALSSATAPAGAQPAAPAPAANAGRSGAPGAAAEHRSAGTLLDTGRVKQRVPPDVRARDAFAKKSWAGAPPAPPRPPPPPPEPPPAAPPPPQAPPLPFKYIGQLQESAERTVWYLLQGERLVVAATGEVVDAVYRIEGAQAGQLRLRYLPLDQGQTLTIGAAP